jgi:UDP-N-acetyl-D-glucosamine dehydrogenase
MPAFVVRKVMDALNEEGRALSRSRILVLGVAYKKDVADLRESPALEIMHLLQDKNADVQYHDALCPVIRDDGHTVLKGLPMRSVELTDEALATADAVLIVTDHSSVDYARVGRLARIVIDTRGVMRGIAASARVVGLSGEPASRVEAAAVRS